MQKNGIIPGIKVDAGAVALTGSMDEKVTQGLDGLRERLTEYHGLGARFAKWRAVITIGDGIPTHANLVENARLLANYAALCQEQKIVPIVEPEVLMDGDHTIERCLSVTTQTLHEVFDALYDHCVVLEHMLLKPNMVIAGKECKVQADVETVAEKTLECFRRTVPAAVPGIVFLSGGQTSALATAHLNAMNALGPHLPWQLSFSYGRALQDEALKAWKGQAANAAAGQKAFFNRAKMNSLARNGKYSEKMEKELVPPRKNGATRDATTVAVLRRRDGTQSRAASIAASSAVANAAWKFNPPIGPCRSRISPHAYRFSKPRTRIVPGSTCVNASPPAVTSARSKPSVPSIGIARPFNARRSDVAPHDRAR